MTLHPSDLVLTLQGARSLHLAAQGLLVPPARAATKASVLATIRRMRVLQIDTIHVVARSPYLVLFSRLGAFPTRLLDELLEEGALFETWSHEACFAPMEDYALHRAHNAAASRHWALRNARKVHHEHRPSLDALLVRIRESGPVKSSDFDRAEGARGGWWGWKAEKRWLEALFALGELMILRRERFQRVYDVAERVLARAGASGISAPPSSEDVRRTLVARAVEALGVARARWIADYFRLGKRLQDADLDGAVQRGELLRVRVRGWAVPGYVHPNHAALLRDAAQGQLRATHTTLLSPFDPVVWDRDRASAFFGFDYRLECYTPEAERSFGYFVLPILRRGRLVGRLDAKAHRREGVFEIKALYLEDEAAPSEAFARDVAGAIRAAAAWHATPEVRLRATLPRAFGKTLRAALRDAAPAAAKSR